MSDAFVNIPSSGSPRWKSPVATAADLPALGNVPGDVRVTLDTSSIYEWNGTMWVLVATPGGATDSFTIMQTPFGTSPVADSPTDTLTWTSSGSTIVITGNSTTDTINLDVSGSVLPSTLTSSHIFVGNASNIATDTAVTGDITINNTGVTAIGANKVTNAQLAQMPANTIKGNNTGVTANAADLTTAQAIALISPLTTKGDVFGYSTVNARIPIGTDGQVLTADSAQTLGLKWATPAATGITSINADTTAAQTLSVGTSGTNFAIVDAGGGSHVFNLPIASATNTGKLSNTDWSTFNSKQAAGNYITALTGDVTATGPGSVAATLATVNSNVGTFGTASQVGTFTVNAKGLITAASNTSIQITESQVTNLVADLAAKQSTTLTSAHLLVGNGSNVATDVAVSGDLTLANTGAFTVAKIQGTTVSGTTGTTNVVFSASPTLTGTATIPIIQGSTASGGTLTLLSTSNATKGKILLGTLSAYDQVNDRLGIGIASPVSKIHLDAGNTTGSVVRMTVGTTTGQTNTDGYIVGIASTGVGQLRNYENQPIEFYTNNTLRYTLDKAGPLVLSPTLQTGASKLHIDMGTATASQLRFTAGTTTGQTATDGLTFGITTAGTGEVRQYENLDLNFFNNNLPTIQFTKFNTVVMGTSAFGASGGLEVTRALSLVGGIGVGILSADQVSDPVGGGIFYGTAIQPASSGSNSLNQFTGALFGVQGASGGANGQQFGLSVNSSFSDENGGTLDQSYGIDVSIDASDSSITDEMVSFRITDPGYNDKSKIMGLQVNGTWGVVEEVDSANTGTQNAYPIISSYTYFTNAGGITLNGIINGKNGKRILLRFSNGATINNNSGSAATGNKILTNSGLAITIVGRGAVELVFSATDNAWCEISSSL